MELCCRDTFPIIGSASQTQAGVSSQLIFLFQIHIAWYIQAFTNTHSNYVYQITKHHKMQKTHNGRTTPTLAKASRAQAGESRLGNSLRKKSWTKAGNLEREKRNNVVHSKTVKDQTCLQQLTHAASSSTVAERKRQDIQSGYSPKGSNKVCKSDYHLMSDVVHRY